MRALIGGNDEHIQPAKINTPNLQDVGFEGKLPASGFNVSIIADTQRQINKALILLGRPMSQDQVNQVLDQQNTKPNKLVKLSYKGKVGWDSRLSAHTFSVESQERSTSEVTHEHESEIVMKRPMHIVQCPFCDKQSPSQQYNFQYRDLDTKIKCSECHKFTPLKGWKCNCGVLWYNCKEHTCAVEIIPNTLSKPKRSSNSKALPKGSLQANSSFEDLLDDDLKVEAKRAKKSLEHDAPLAGDKMPYKLKASLLSPNLRQRFAHLL